MQKENPVANIRCAKYKFTERSHDFVMKSHVQLIFSDLGDLDKLQICAKGKSISEFHSVSMGIRKMEKMQQSQKKKKYPRKGGSMKPFKYFVLFNFLHLSDAVLHRMEFQNEFSFGTFLNLLEISKVTKNRLHK